MMQHFSRAPRASSAADAALACTGAGSRAQNGVPSALRSYRYRRPTCARTQAVEVTAQEEAANEKRWQESGQQGGLDEWSWTLNWDAIRDDIVVGSCPRSAEDIVRFSALVCGDREQRASCDVLICA